MGKKLGSYRVLSCTLAVLATLVFIVACGDGELEDVIKNPEITWPINNALDNLKNDEDRLSSIVQKPSSPSVPKSSSSDGEDPGPGDSSDSGNTQSSSDGEEPSSASSPNSSSSEEATTPSSSSESPYFITCDVVVPKITVKWTDQSIPDDNNRPVVKCKAKEGGAEVYTFTGGSISWTKDGKLFSWRSISEILGVHNDGSIQVEINDTECKGGKASCKGELEICYSGECRGDPQKPSSSSVASSSSRSSSSSVPPPATSSSSSATSNETKGPCKENNNERYCRWEASAETCYKIDSQYSDIPDGSNKCGVGTCTCTALIKHCSDNGYLYGTATSCDNDGKCKCSGIDLNGKNPSAVGCCNWDNNNGQSNCWTEQLSNTSCPKWMNQTGCNPNNGTCPK